MSNKLSTRSADMSFARRFNAAKGRANIFRVAQRRTNKETRPSPCDEKDRGTDQLLSPGVETPG